MGYFMAGGVEAREVDAGYRGNPVLSGVTLEVRYGETVAVLGPNGAGKSTLLRVLAGTLPVTSGRVTIAGSEIASLPRRMIARQIAVVPQESDVAFGFTVRQVVMMGRAPYQAGLLRPSNADRSAVARALDVCDMSELAERPVDELSGGERRRVVIARALAQEARTLLLDEPAAHLDIRHATLVYEIARRQVEEQQMACLAVMHDLNAAARWADRVVLLAGGKVVASGPVDDVMQRESLERVFGVGLATGETSGGHRYFLPS